MTTVHRAAITVGFAPQPSECADPVNGSFAPEAVIRRSNVIEYSLAARQLMAQQHRAILYQLPAR
jgi:hypothetical protein